jgi:hypothetical protein
VKNCQGCVLILAPVYPVFNSIATRNGNGDNNRNIQLGVIWQFAYSGVVVVTGHHRLIHSSKEQVAIQVGCDERTLKP